ncbi:MAG: methanol--corrinoid methyltransferase [Calditrichaeota bacterium]|nr:methanol--corrinoid methyltransferase [Calditrichota bacterium]
MKYQKLAIETNEKMIFGSTPFPVKTRRGLSIGGGNVYSELNFTLPPMEITDKTLGSIQRQYADIITGAIKRARELDSNGVIFEFEALLEMTLQPKIGIELVKIMNDICEENYQKYGFKSEIRLTPNDLREFDRPPKMRTGAYLEKMLELFEKGAEAGGDLLSIESTGGKEIFDDAVLMCDIKSAIFSLAVLGVRDMKFLWRKIVDIAAQTNRIPGGDTACGFGNTAMILADQGMIPKVFAAIVRIVSVVRSLVALEEGATGPDKDCGYEGVFLKAIAGIPISMEGKTAACAHLSGVGNVAAACADLWSNESVQNSKMLAGMAPTVYLEQLEYDVRLMNAAIKKGNASAHQLQDLFVESDIHLDPQALILSPENAIEISKEIIKGDSYLDAAIRGSLKGIEIIKQAIATNSLRIDEREMKWLERIHEDILSIPREEDKFIEEILPSIDEGKFIPSEYGL